MIIMFSCIILFNDNTFHCRHVREAVRSSQGHKKEADSITRSGQKEDRGRGGG